MFVKCCPDHGKKTLDATFCDECGKKLLLIEEEPKPGICQVAGTQPCPHCGYELNHEYQQFCPGCGVFLRWIVG